MNFKIQMKRKGLDDEARGAGGGVVARDRPSVLARPPSWWWRAARRSWAPPVTKPLEFWRGCYVPVRLPTPLAAKLVTRNT